MYVKIMSEQNLPDSHPSKSFRLVTCRRVSFARSSDGKPIAYIDGRLPEPCDGNVYVLNDAGKTIESFAFNAPQSPVV